MQKETLVKKISDFVDDWGRKIEQSKIAESQFSRLDEFAPLTEREFKEIINDDEIWGQYRGNNSWIARKLPHKEKIIFIRKLNRKGRK